MLTRRNEIIFASLVAFLIAWSVLLTYVSPVEIVAALGVRNALLIAFGVGLAGGLSSFTAASFIITIATLAAGGTDPYMLGLAGGLGVFGSDSVFFYAATKGRHVIEDRWSRFAHRLYTAIHRLPLWAVRVFVFVYAAATPLPSDIMIVVLALGRYRYRAIAPALFLGDIAFVLVVALLGHLTAL